MLPAAHGDALWIEFGPRESPTRIVIDGGPASTYARGLRARIERMKAEGSNRIDLFVVTHIDCDHIDGAVIFLRECKDLKVSIGEVWFNSWKHLPETAEAFQPLQGEFLSALIAKEPRVERVWNRSFNHQAVAVPSKGKLPSLRLPNNGALTLLSPFAKQLFRLRSQWSSAIRDFTPGDEKSALARLEQRRDYRPPKVPDTFSAQTYGADRSPPNGSSIAFLLEHGGHSCLFAGDAHARVLVDSLRILTKERGVTRLSLSAFKLPHHGSMGNVNPELLSLVSCKNWLISTNGAIFDHPDRQTVELIASAHKQPMIHCNYRVASTLRLVPRGTAAWTVAFPPEERNSAPVGGLRLEFNGHGTVAAPPNGAKRRKTAKKTRVRKAKRQPGAGA